MDHLENELKNYYQKKPSKIQSLISQRPIVENIEDFERSDNSISFTFKYDEIEQKASRDGMIDVVAYNVGKVKIVNYSGDFIYMIYANSTTADKIKYKLSKLVFGKPKAISKLKFDGKVIGEISDVDAEKISHCAWDDIDSNTTRAILKGNLEESGYYSQFGGAKKSSDLIFLSRKLKKVARITHNGKILLYGSTDDYETIEDYFFAEVYSRTINAS